MIFIDRKQLKFNEIQPLIDAADAAQNAIDAEPDPKRRKKLIDAYQPLWVAFRQAFSVLSNGKCWYTESENPGTDDDIDHFRPKNRLDDEKKHGGYYWLALKWDNFRLSCHRANRLRENPETKKSHGKADRFPLLNPDKRAWTPHDDVQAERPMLLDPCDPSDPPKLTFNTDGTIAVALRYENDASAIQQIEASRVALHLDWPDFVDHRIELYNRVYRMVKEGDDHWVRGEAGDNGSKMSWKSIVADLRDLIKEGRSYSAAARAFIMRFRYVWWVEDMVLQMPEAAHQQGAA